MRTPLRRLHRGREPELASAMAGRCGSWRPAVVWGPSPDRRLQRHIHSPLPGRQNRCRRTEPRLARRRHDARNAQASLARDVSRRFPGWRRSSAPCGSAPIWRWRRRRRRRPAPRGRPSSKARRQASSGHESSDRRSTDELRWRRSCPSRVQSSRKVLRRVPSALSSVSEPPVRGWCGPGQLRASCRVG